MERKKTPSQDVYKRSSMHFNIGLIIALALVITAFEFRTFTTDIIVEGNLMRKGPTEELVIPPTEHIVSPPAPVPMPNPEVNPVEFEPDPEVVVELPPLDVHVTTGPPNILDVITGELNPPIEDTEEVKDFFALEVQPTHGYDFYGYIAKNIRFPRAAARIGLEGRVFVEFIVDKDGSLTDVKVLKGIGGGCDEEAVRVIESAPKWNPGKQRGVPVKVRMVIPVMFKSYN